METELILPSEIPWNEIKRSDLEELLYWLFDSMGAKDLEWRIGGKGQGASDQGRDLELVFFTPSPDGTLTKQIWWVEAKGRKKTVEPSAVQEAVINATGKKHVDVLVVSTNANFSNPTRDWVKDWQSNNPRPIIKLWEKTELESLCSKNPLAVIRLYKKAISLQGNVEVTSSKLWNYASFTDEITLIQLWNNRENIKMDERALFALIASEIANGDIALRSWGLLVSDEDLVSCLYYGLINLIYLVLRTNERGINQKPIIKTLTYLILLGINRINNKTVVSILENFWKDLNDSNCSDDDKYFILEPILNTLQIELRDVCSCDCGRVSIDPELLDEIEIDKYWDILKQTEYKKTKNKNNLLIEFHDKPCKVGFNLNEKVGCPLCNMEKPHLLINSFIDVVDKVVKYRSSHEKNI